VTEGLHHKSVVITGGGSGIGLATARRLVTLGARVLIADLRAETIDRALAELSALGAEPSGSAAHGQTCDVRLAADCDRLIAAAGERFGALDAVVHCAGILRAAGSRPRPLHEMEDHEFAAVVDTNLKGTFLLNRAALRLMVAQRNGQIINVASTSGRKGRPLDSVYSASKAGVIALSESVAEEVRPFGVRVQVILPDAVDTPLWEQNGAIKTAPPQALPAERVAELIAFCLALPPDTICENLVIAPFRTRVSKRAAPAAENQRGSPPTAGEGR
jgi:NAD(P)-dependent dehydrogenase (short-subunit alcohol dehydrogenase family)